VKTPRIIEGDARLGDLRIALVASRFNAEVVDRLVAGAVDALASQGADPATLELVRVPGAYDLPLVARRLAESGKCDAIVALGAVIRGDTPHFDYVAGECAKGVAQVSLAQDIPVAFGVLTTDTIEQAIERAGTKAGNKGVDAALSAIEMVNVLKQIRP
jgi:6,7-dimethyl-8-ribityllumazine synthase